MFCRKCGTELKDEWQVCPNCGEPVPKDNEENTENEGIDLSESDTEAEEDPSEVKRRDRNFF